MNDFAPPTTTLATVAVGAFLTVAQWSNVAVGIIIAAAVVIVGTLALMWSKVSDLDHSTGRLTHSVDGLRERVGSLEEQLKADD